MIRALPLLWLILLQTLAGADAGAAPSLASSQASPPACRKIMAACRKGGFVHGPKNRHPGQGLWASCVRPIAKGHPVPGVTGASKRDALSCLEARKAKRAPRG